MFSFQFPAFSRSFLFKNGGRCHARCRPAHREPFDTSKCRPADLNQQPSNNKMLALHLSHSRPLFSSISGIILNWVEVCSIGQGRTHTTGLNDWSLVIKLITNYFDSPLIGCSIFFKKKRRTFSGSSLLQQIINLWMWICWFTDWLSDQFQLCRRPNTRQKLKAA